MTFIPMDAMLRRVETNGTDSDVVRFSELLLAGELLLKTTTAAFLSGLENDTENHRYRLTHALVRADGIGEWAVKLDEILSGPATQNLTAGLSEDRRVFNERVGEGTWQYEAVQNLQEVLSGIQPTSQPMASKVTLRSWFAKFAEVRNKTRGHGATTPATCAKLVPFLEKSIRIIVQDGPLLQHPWAYLHRNLSGKYRVVGLGGDQSVFSSLKSVSAINGPNHPAGVYIYAGRPLQVELIYADLNATDFSVPNGDFNGRTFEALSLITDTRTRLDAAPYLGVPSDRPISETEGSRELDIIGKTFSNIPGLTTEYVSRPRLEREVREVLMNDRHPIVTLVGRGGIGKTSLALKVLREIAETERFDFLVWFSARDVDLAISGPRLVKPGALTEREIADQYWTLLNNTEMSKEDRANILVYMADRLNHIEEGKTLFVFDNFETVRSPIDLFQWLDTHIRLPNKIMITSRFREFKADFPIEITGMEQDEAITLIANTANKLAISRVVSDNQRDQIYDESGGHPYIIKIILGEIASSGAFNKPSAMLVRKDSILDALFERSYSNLTPMAARIFLTLCSWRSMVPQIAVEAVLLRHMSDGGDPERAIDELVRMSLVERTKAKDESDFLSVPLTAALFGRKKLEVNPYRDAIESDLKFLQDLGPTTRSGLKEGVRPRIIALFRRLARRIEEGSTSLDDVRQVLEFVARTYTPAWLLLADLMLEVGEERRLDAAANYVRRFLEESAGGTESQLAWQKLINIYRELHDVRGACNALLRLSETSDVDIDQISTISNWLNNDRGIIDNTLVVDRESLFRPLAGLFEKYLLEASATDLSRLAWLHLHAGDETRALEVAELGLKKDAFNPYCERLVERLTGY